MKYGINFINFDMKKCILLEKKLSIQKCAPEFSKAWMINEE